MTEDWDVIETADGVYNWSSLDAKIAIAKAAGFNYLGLGITWSSFNTPEWLRTELKDAGQTIPLRDPGTIHHTYCEEIDVPFYWSQRWHAKWLALIAAAGAHYTNDPAIVATFASAFDHNSLDWNIQDFVGDLLNCPHFAWHMEHRKQAGTRPFRMPALLGALPCAAGLLAVPGNASSQVPRGVFSIANDMGKVTITVLLNPDMDGISLRQSWATIEPTEGVFDFSYLDSTIATCAPHGK